MSCPALQESLPTFVEENMDDFVVEEDSLEKIKVDFNDFISDYLNGKKLNVEPMKIELVENAQPYKVYTTRQIPVHLEKEANKMIKLLISNGIISPVPITDVSEWTAPDHFIPKPNGGVRLVTDFSKVNQYVKRPVHPFPSCVDIKNKIPAHAQWCFGQRSLF